MNPEIAKLIELVKENPELEIMPMIDEDVCSEGWGSVSGEWGSPEVDEYYVNDKTERIYSRSEDYEELYDEIYDQIKGDVSEGIATAIVVERFNNLPWKKAIFIRIHRT